MFGSYLVLHVIIVGKFLLYSTNQNLTLSQCLNSNQNRNIIKVHLVSLVFQRAARLLNYWVSKICET